MTEEATPSLFYRLKRPLVLALVGMVTVAVGAGTGLWLMPGNPQVDQENSQSGGESAGTQPPRDALQPENPLTDEEADYAPLPEEWDQPASPTDSTAAYVRKGDMALQVGDYQLAISVYRTALRGCSMGSPAEASLIYRMALASECLGAVDDALEQYQAITQKFFNQTWNDVAQLGRMRCLSQATRPGAMDAVLYRAVVLDNTVLVPPVREEMLHVAAQGLCRALLSKRSDDLLSEQTLLLPDWPTDPNRELQVLSALLSARRTPQGPAGLELLQSYDDRNPQHIFFRMHTENETLQTLLTGLCGKAGLRLKLTKAARDIVQARRQVVHTDDLQLSLLLDGLCVPFGMIWQWHDDEIRIAAGHEWPERQRGKFVLDRTERLLNLAGLEAGTSWHAGHTEMAHGVMQFERNKPGDAAHTFRRLMDGGSNRESGVEVGFNLGKCYLKLQQSQEAEQAWYRCVDSGGRDRSTRTAAYALLGRLQLQDGRFEDGIRTMIQGLYLSRGTPLEAQSAVMLAAAYLFQGNADRAASVIMEHKQAIQPSDVVRAGDFVSAVARFRAAGPVESYREREAQDVLTTVNQFDPSSMFGSYWYVLAAQAFDELGLTDRALGLYTEAIRQLGTGGLRKAAMVRLAARFRDEARLVAARQVLEATLADGNTPLDQEVRLLKADVAFREKDYPVVVTACHHVIVSTEDQALRRRALGLMGRAYQKQEDHESAVYCFTGMLPRALTHQAEQTSPQEVTQ